MAILLFFIGLIGNIIGTLVGGSGLITLPTMLLIGIPTHSAIGANKISSMFGTFTAILSVIRKKELVWKEIFPILIIGSLGGMAGGLAANWLSAKTLTLIAIILMVFAFFISILGKTAFGNQIKLVLSKKLTTLLFSIGFYDGIFGPGSGTLFIYLFASEKFTYMKAMVLGRVGVFSTCIGAAIIYISAGHILWYETLFLTAGSIIGSQIGIILARKVSNNAAQIILRCITIILIVQLTIEFLSQK